MEIYINLNKRFKIENFVCRLLEIDFFSDIYVFFKNFKYSKTFFNLFEETIDFLNKYSFSYIRLHIIHPYREDLQTFYLKIYQSLKFFNLEGYNHQIMPRLIVFPIFLSTLPESFKNFLESHFFLPGIILDKKIQDTSLERVFIKTHGNPLLSIGYQNVLLNLLENIYSPRKDWRACRSMLIFEDGKTFPCIYAYEKKMFTIDKTICNLCLYKLIKKLSSSGLMSSQELTNLYFRLGLELLETGNPKMAVKHFYEALKYASSNEKKEIYSYLGIYKAQLGEYNSAIKYLNKAKFDHNTYFYLGFSYFQKNEFLEAKKNLEKALKFEMPFEDKLPIILYLGHTYKALKLYKKAISLCEELSNHVELEEVFNLLGTCYFKLKAYDKAVECFKKAILIDPYSAIDYANLCLSLKELNKKEEAIYYGEKALGLNPELEFVKKALEEIRND